LVINFTTQMQVKLKNGTARVGLQYKQKAALISGFLLLLKLTTNINSKVKT